jgi:hypothetical protein
VLDRADVTTIDRMCGVPGIGEAMAFVGWVVEEGSEGRHRRLRFPNFLSESSPYDKTKRAHAEAQRRYREKKRDGKSDGHGDITSDVTMTPREEKRREEKNIEEKTPKPPPETTTQDKPKSGSVQPKYTQEFQRFWTAYPNPKNKAEAFKAWQKLRPDEALILVVLQAIEKQKQTFEWKKNGGQFIPYPASWLNGRRWEDELRPNLPVTSGPTLEQQADYEAKMAKQRAEAERNQRAEEASRKLREERGGSFFGDRHPHHLHQ